MAKKATPGSTAAYKVHTQVVVDPPDLSAAQRSLAAFERWASDSAKKVRGAYERELAGVGKALGNPTSVMTGGTRPRRASGGGGSGGSSGGSLRASSGGSSGGGPVKPTSSPFDQLLGFSGLTGMAAGFTFASVVGQARSAVSAAYSVVDGIIQIGIEAESSQAQIASLLSSVEGMSIAAAQSGSRTIFQQLSEDAARGVGGVKDYLRAYQQIYAPARSAGADEATIRRFVSQSLTAGFAIRGQQGLELAPLDIVQALNGGVNDKVTPIAVQALRAAGTSESDFNAAGRGERLALLQAGFARFDEAAEMMGQTIEAQTATLEDNFARLGRRASEVPLELFRTTLFEANDAIKLHEDALMRGADAVGVASAALVDGLVVAGASALEWGAEGASSGALGQLVAATGEATRSLLVMGGNMLATVPTALINVISRQITMAVVSFDALFRVVSSGAVILDTFFESLGNSLRSFVGDVLGTEISKGLLGESSPQGNILLTGGVDAPTGPQQPLGEGDSKASRANYRLYVSPRQDRFDARMAEIWRMETGKAAEDAAKAEQSKAKEDGKKAAERPIKVEVDLKHPVRIEWGNDGQAQVALGDLITEVATRIAENPLGGGGGLRSPLAVF